MISGEVIGPIATPSRSRKCPSQPSFGVHATLRSVGVRNPVEAASDFHRSPAAARPPRTGPDCGMSSRNGLRRRTGSDRKTMCGQARTWRASRGRLSDTGLRPAGGTCPARRASRFRPAPKIDPPAPSSNANAPASAAIFPISPARCGRPVNCIKNNLSTPVDEPLTKSARCAVRAVHDRL